MKKKIAVAVVVVGMGLAGLTQAYAGWGQRGGNFYNCPQYQEQGMPAVTQVDPATQEKIDKFLEDTTELRKQMAMKRAERRALMAAATPDPAALSKVAGELFDLRDTMRKKAEDAGVAGLIGPRGGFGMGGPGDGDYRGKGGKGGRGMMNNSGFGPGCWQNRF